MLHPTSGTVLAQTPPSSPLQSLVQCAMLAYGYPDPTSCRNYCSPPSIWPSLPNLPQTPVRLRPDRNHDRYLHARGPSSYNMLSDGQDFDAGQDFGFFVRRTSDLPSLRYHCMHHAFSIAVYCLIQQQTARRTAKMSTPEVRKSDFVDSVATRENLVCG